MKAIKRLLLNLFSHLDLPLLAIVLALMGIGLLTVYSATSSDGFDKLDKQIINMAVSFVVMLAVARTPPQTLMRFAVPLYVTGVVLLVGVALFGVVVNGSRRWLSLGFTRIQPSELMKIAMPLMLAWYFHKYESALKARHFLIASAILMIPILLVLKQPDLGTSLLIGASGFFVIFLAGLPWKVIIGMGAAAGAALPFAWTMLHDYQRRRVLTLLDPTSDPLGAGYHIIQSTIAIGSGGGLGKGWLNGTQTHLEFIPEKHTDFIFAVFSEEWGLLGNGILLVLFTLLIGRGLAIAAAAPTLFSRLLAGALTLVFFIYAFVNMGMVSGILPVVGVPLPFVSYGGTALVTLMVGIGVLMSIHTHRMLVKK
ncbi:rod shape-determining protein RodA [Azonexus sp. R2A61]|uniref:rod shape-determining protein RodA n=1 Tax=Azonexus sp. R2A61 TaxID=2744443 RepID=UPI001F203A63|nr:rod shape-determining protein RodA [Azonexus sp. R2A61]